MADRAGHQGCHPKQVVPQTTFQLRQEILQTATPHRECLLPAQRFPTHRHPLRQARQKFPRLRLRRRCRCMVDFMSRDPRDRVGRQRGKCEGRNSYAEREGGEELVAAARQLYAKPNGRSPSLRTIAAALASRGYVTPTGRPYSASAVASMLTG